MLGSVLSLLSAFFWASAVILFKKSGEVFSPISLNIYKSFVALILVSLTMVILNIPFFPDKPINDWLLLAASGFIGITLADLFFFIALNRLGAGLVAIVECLYLPSVIFFSFILLGENLSVGAIIGGLLVLTAVFVGSIKRKKDLDKTLKQRRENKNPLPGIIIGCLSMIFLAAGIVMIKNLLERTDVFWATLVRVTAATVSLLVLILFHPKRKQYFRELKFSKGWLIALPASFTGNYLALLCWVAGMKYTTASRAAILNQMSTIFIFILAAIFLKEKITVNKSIAILLALTGACLAIFI
ncbi:DMT family transporter [Desulfobacula sp.]|uniref:DMT family transporter n=1 Tax=Desulfobacula sp. TaxID=2593537 RepID=UPI0025C5B159|nr:DMT family transporter [Desulfobacula sp.]MBC2705064.1 DMT family transporter [Desulfobacula sp.]